MDEQEKNVVVEVAKQISKDVYNDGGKSIVKNTGETVGLIPRAIKAALLPVEKWILQREYSLKETEKLLEEKLKNINPENIETPEAYIAVPVLQYISYCMSSEELRDMYANLLANSMNKVIKNRVHPGFVEIIKQLSPDEAKILKSIYYEKTVPTITVRYENKEQGGVNIFKDFSNIAEKSNCEDNLNTNKYFDNLKRLGLINGVTMRSLIDKRFYEPLKNNSYIKSLKDIPDYYKKQGYTEYVIKESYIEITDYGNEFCEICINEMKS